MSEKPRCRDCYLATLSPDERQHRLQEVPRPHEMTTVFLCPEHQAKEDEMLTRFKDWIIDPRVVSISNTGIRINSDGSVI